MLSNLLHICNFSVRKIFVAVSDSVCRSSPRNSCGRSADILGIYEEEEFILYDRSSESETIYCLTVLFPCSRDFNSCCLVTAHILVAVIYVGTALECVCTGFGNCIHTTADKVCLADIVR